MTCGGRLALACGLACPLFVVPRLLYLLQLFLAALLQFPFPLVLVLMHDMHKRVGNSEIAIPFVIGGHDIPGGVLRVASGNGVLVGFLIGVPVFAIFPVRERKLPGFVLVLLARQQPAFLAREQDKDKAW